MSKKENLIYESAVNVLSDLADLPDEDWFENNNFITKDQMLTYVNVTSPVDDMCLPINCTSDSAYYTITTSMGQHTAKYISAEAESKANQIEYQANLFKDSVQDLLNNILRVSPAGSASFELAKDFMDKHYGEESK
jgi:hypothetical protein